MVRNAVAVTRALGLDDHTPNRMYWAGVLHDLGRLSVPEANLTKQSRLTTEEFEIIKDHPACGAQILLDISGTFADIAGGVGSHHERWNGGGYLDSLAWEAIPLVSRILAVVDVFEAVTSNRPYRGPMGVDAACRMPSVRLCLHHPRKLLGLGQGMRIGISTLVHRH